ncbi:hypothetical protein, partial [Angustibacter peucedani]
AKELPLPFVFLRPLGLRLLSNRPAVDAAQATQIAARALGQAQRADALRTDEAAKTAFTGLALKITPARYVVEKVLDPSKDASGGALEPVVEPSRIVVTAGRSFPRTLLAVWTPEGSSTAQVAVLESTDVRTPFKVAVRADLLPGAGLPPTAPAARGASVLPRDVDGLVATPEKAVADLARLLQTGTSGGTPFAANVVVKDVRTKAAQQAKDVAKVATFQQVHAAEPYGLRVVRTADGGAVVVAAIDRTDSFTVKKGAGVITPPPAYRALSGGKLKKITKRASVRTVQTVVLVLPRQGAGPARLVGFSEVPVQVSGR